MVSYVMLFIFGESISAVIFKTFLWWNYIVLSSGMSNK